MSSSPKALLERHGLRPKKSFGQNFLADENLARRIAELCALPGATVIELGAGLGALTRPLLATGARVVAVERDRELVPALRELFATEIEEGRLRVEEADAKTFDMRGLGASSSGPFVLAGNLPYQITGPLLERAIGLQDFLVRVVFLVQLEVADRLAASAADDAYGALSVFAQAAFNVERALVIRKGAFYPQPQVDSAVVVLTPRAERIAETPTFRALVHGAFRQRRKKLSNAWRSVLDLPSERVAVAAAAAGINLDARGETLSAADFARMAAELERETT